MSPTNYCLQFPLFCSQKNMKAGFPHHNLSLPVTIRCLHSESLLQVAVDEVSNLHLESIHCSLGREVFFNTCTAYMKVRSLMKIKDPYVFNIYVSKVFCLVLLCSAIYTEKCYTTIFILTDYNCSKTNATKTKCKHEFA